MQNKIYLILCIVLFINISLYAQHAPVKSFSLKKEPTEIAPDSLGTTYFYSLSFEVPDTLVLASATFKLKGLTTDSLFNQQIFNLPTTDGVYQTGYFPNGLIKDQYTFFILLGNIKSKEQLILVSDFKDSNNIQYNNIHSND